MKKNKVKLFMLVLFMIMFSNVCSQSILQVYAKEENNKISGRIYEFDRKSHYELSDANVVDGATAFGELAIFGDFKSIGERDGVPAYEVDSGNIEMSYLFDQMKLKEDDKEWNLVEDKANIINSVSFEDKINCGALLLESSLDGEKWTKDIVKTNIFTEETDLTAFYATKDIQQENGCYYRIIIAYEVRMKLDDKKILFVDVDNYDYKKIAEVYEFYVINDDMLKEDITKPTDVPRKELGSKVNAGKDTGFVEENAIELDDPHYGWDLGTFFVNGYTRETISDEGTPVFLKNVGDQVTLWFHLQQDIDCLNGDEALAISSDENGYDQKFEIEKTNFKHGTLIIGYTDYQGIKHDPVIYTDFLAASAKTGADTRVKLFEEGDYEVTLDYEIENSQRRIGPVPLFPSFTNYKISFKFLIRNGNCMVYPIDIGTGNELSEGAITENGFSLDMAKSRYLTIDVTKTALNTTEDGTRTEDVRFSRPAQDGERYTEEGIYTFTVKNLYTNGEPVTKTLYVGTDKFLKALSVSGLSVKELNEQILRGVSIEEDGSFLVSEESELESELSEKIETVPEQTETEMMAEIVDTPKKTDTKKIVASGTAMKDEGQRDKNYGLIVLCSIVAVVIGTVAFKKQYIVSKKQSSGEDRTE